jgi:hypothetical protein
LCPYRWRGCPLEAFDPHVTRVQVAPRSTPPSRGEVTLPRDMASDPQAWDRHRDRLHHKRWIVYAKRPFGGAEHVVRYLGRYTHRLGISNQRFVRMAD